MSDLYAKQLANELIAADETEVRARRKMQNKLMRALPPKKAARYLQVEAQIRAIQLYTIAEAFPLVPIAIDPARLRGDASFRLRWTRPGGRARAAARRSGLDNVRHSCKIPRFSDEAWPRHTAGPMCFGVFALAPPHFRGGRFSGWRSATAQLAVPGASGDQGASNQQPAWRPADHPSADARIVRTCRSVTRFSD